MMRLTTVMQLSLTELLVAIWRGWWWYWFRIVDATWIGTAETPALVFYDVPWVKWGAICLGRRIYCRGSRATAALLTHEYTHVRQYQAYGFVTYLVLWWFHTKRVGYLDNPFEREAEREAASLWVSQWELGREKTYGPGDFWTPHRRARERYRSAFTTK